MTPQLIDSHRRIRDCTFRHPAPRNLGWGDMRSMLRTLAEVAETDPTETQFLARGWDFYSTIAQLRTAPLPRRNR